MGSSPVKIDISGVWEATGAVVKSEFRGPLTFFGTSSFFYEELSFFDVMILICVFDIFAKCEVRLLWKAEKSLFYRAGVCGKAVGVAACCYIGTSFSFSVTSM